MLLHLKYGKRNGFFLHSTNRSHHKKHSRRIQLNISSQESTVLFASNISENFYFDQTSIHTIFFTWKLHFFFNFLDLWMLNRGRGWLPVFHQTHPQSHMQTQTHRAPAGKMERQDLPCSIRGWCSAHPLLPKAMRKQELPCETLEKNFLFNLTHDLSFKINFSSILNRGTRTATCRFSLFQSDSQH